MPGVGFIRPAGGGGAGGGGATLEIGVFSDAGHTTPITSADFGDTIYIKSTVTGITPTEYRFFVFETASNGVATVQVGDSISYDITSFNDLVIYAEAKDASVAAAAFTSFEVTVNSDVDADAFINAHNALSGLTMAAAQEEVVQGLFQMLKGFGTPNGTDILTYQRTNAHTTAFPLVPVSDSIVNADAYALDIFHLTVGTYNGFIPTDFSVNGVTGGAGKYFNSTKSPSQLPIDDYSVGVYSRTNSSNNNISELGSANSGTANATLAQLRTLSVGTVFWMNDSNSNNFAISDSLGSFRFYRSGTTKSVSRDGILIGSATRATTGQSTLPMYFHAFNQNNISISHSNRQLCFYEQTLGMSAAMAEDWEFAKSYLQANIITGGRNV